MLTRACCCGTCTNPTGATTLTATRQIVVEKPTAPFGGSWDAEWYMTMNLVFSGTSLTPALSNVRLRYREEQDLRFPDNSIWGQYDRELDATFEPASGSIACDGSGSLVCGDCGTGTVYRFDPTIVLPYGTSNGSITLNTYTNTITGYGGLSAPDWLGFDVLGSEQALSDTTGSTACSSRLAEITNPWTYDGTSWTRPSTSAQAEITPLRVYGALGSSGPTAVCPPIDQLTGVYGDTSTGVDGASGARFYDLANVFPARCILNACRGGRRYLEDIGWTFTTDTASATIS